MALSLEWWSARWVTTLILLAIGGLFAHGRSTWQKDRKKRQLGCVDPPRYPHRDPFGYDLVAARQEATRQGRSDAFDKSLFDCYGRTFEALRWGTWRQRVIWTCEPSNIQTIAALAFHHFEFRPLRQSFGPFLGDGLLTTDGPGWAHSRAMVKPIFRRSRIGNFPAFEVHVQRFLDLIPRDGTTIDLQPLLKRLFLDTSTEFFLGQSMESLLPSSYTGVEEFLAAFDEALRGMARSVWLGWFGGFLQWNPILRQAQEKVYASLDTYVDRAIRRANGELRSDASASNDYVLVDEMAKECKDPRRLRHELLNIFLPARDTTGIAMALVLYNLARNPRVYTKLRAEILRQIPPETEITFEGIKAVTYLRYVLNESKLRLFVRCRGADLKGLRLRSPVHWSQRTCCQDCVLPTGGGKTGKDPIFVSKGDAVTINVHALHLDTGIWGSDAANFRPERWQTERPTWEYLPFLGGPRICPAQQMALAECSYLLVRLMQEFKAIENRDMESWAIEVRLQAESRHGVKVGLIPARG